MRFVAALLFLLASGPAWSAWTFVSGDASGSLHADFETVRQRDELREVWTLYAERAGVDRSVPSTQALVLFDCKYKEYQTIFVASYSGPSTTQARHGGGLRMHDDLSQPWLAIVRDSTYEKIFSQVCAHRLELSEVTKR